MAEWISVKDRLPEAGASVLVTDGEVVDFLYALSDTTLETRYSITITHWMPIPQPPKEKSDE